MVIERLLNLVQLYKDKVADIVQDLLATLKVLDKAPVENLPKLEDIKESYERGEISHLDTIIVSARIGDLLTSAKYNRGDNLRYGNQERDLLNMGGFSYSAAGVLSGYLRPSLDAVVTQGNNRVSMLYAVTQNLLARIPIALKFHEQGINEDEMIRIEAENHNADCNFRTVQSGDDKFKSAYYSNQSWAIDIFNLLEPFSIGIAGTLEGAKVKCHSHNYISKAFNEAGHEYTNRYLKVFTDVGCADYVLGNNVRGGATFLKVFAKHIAEVDAKNGCIDSFRNMMKYYFVDRKSLGEQAREVMKQYGQTIPVEACITQEDILKGSRLIKTHHIYVCRYVSLYNEYCKKFDLNFNMLYKRAIPVDGVAMAVFTQDVPAILRQALLDYARSPVVATDE